MGKHMQSAQILLNYESFCIFVCLFGLCVVFHFLMTLYHKKEVGYRITGHIMVVYWLLHDREKVPCYSFLFAGTYLIC